MKIEIEPLTDLLLGAAYADKRLEGSEREAIERIVTKILKTDRLPEAVAGRFRSFNPARFDAAACAAAYRGLSEPEKRKILELVATVSDADESFDLSESEYLVTVAKGLGMPPSAYEDLTLEVLDEDDLEGFFDIFEEGNG